MNLAKFVKEKRKSVHLTQPELAEKAGVGLRFLRELEQGKKSMRLMVRYEGIKSMESFTHHNHLYLYVNLYLRVPDFTRS